MIEKYARSEPNGWMTASRNMNGNVGANFMHRIDYVGYIDNAKWANSWNPMLSAHIASNAIGIDTTNVVDGLIDPDRVARIVRMSFMSNWKWMAMNF